MANVLDSGKQQQILALGKLGWTLRRIEEETGIRRETVSRYLKRSGIEVRPRGRRGHLESKAAIKVITDSGSDSKAASMRRPSVSTSSLLFYISTALAGANCTENFDLPPGFHSHSWMIRIGTGA